MADDASGTTAKLHGVISASSLTPRAEGKHGDVEADQDVQASSSLIDDTASSLSDGESASSDHDPDWSDAILNRDCDWVRELLTGQVDIDASWRDLGYEDEDEKQLEDEYKYPKEGDILFPLYFAAKEGLVDIVEVLLTMQPDLEKKCKGRGWTALHVSVSRGHSEIVKRLLSAGANVNARTKNSKATALSIAIRWGHEERPRLS